MAAAAEKTKQKTLTNTGVFYAAEIMVPIAAALYDAKNSTCAIAEVGYKPSLGLLTIISIILSPGALSFYNIIIICMRENKSHSLNKHLSAMVSAGSIRANLCDYIPSNCTLEKAGAAVATKLFS